MSQAEPLSSESERERDDAAQLPQVESAFQLRIERIYGTRTGPAVNLTEDVAEGGETSVAGVTSERIKRLRSTDPELHQRYLLEGEIGRGGMGAVLRVFDADLRRRLAMKVIHGTGAETDTGPESIDPGRLLRFLEEAQVTGQLDHPGIVPVHELGVDSEGRVYFTMRLVRGRELSHVFERVHAGDPEWTRTRALGVLLKVCEAMAYAHDKGVIHRDLKPSNVMVGRHGEVYVMDWGLARISGRDDTRDLRPRPSAEQTLTEVETDRRDAAQRQLASPIVTMDGSVMGTPFFMPPEQAAGRLAEIGPHSDVYALGAMLYQLLSGRMPYHEPGNNTSAYTVLAMVMHAPPTPLLELAPDVPPELEAICEKAMAREISARYPHIGALAEDLRAYLENRVVRAHRTGALIELRKWVGRNRGLATAIAALVVVTVVGSGTAAVVLRAKNGQIVSARDEALLAAQVAVEAKERADEAALQQTLLRAEAEQARTASERVTNFLVRQLEALEPESTRGRELQVSDLLDSAARSLEEELSATTPEATRLREVVGGAYRSLGLFEAAEPLLERAWRDRVRQLGETEQATLKALGELAGLYRDQGRLSEAETEFARALEARREALGGDHPDTLVSQRELALLYQDQGRYAKAERLLVDTLEKSRAALPDDDPELSTILQSLAGVYQDQERLDQAEPLFVEVLKRSRARVGEDHPDTITGLHDLAELYHDQERLTEAEPLYERALVQSRAVLGADHPDTLQSLYSLGSLYQSQGRYVDAEPLLRQALERSRAALNQNHPVTLNALYLLAGLEHGLDHFPEAESLYLESLERSRAVLGDDHPDTLLTIDDLDELYGEWLAKLHELQGQQHPETLAVLSRLGHLCVELGDLKRAELLLRRVLERGSASLDKADATRLLALQDLVELLVSQHRWQEAAVQAAELVEATPQGSSERAARAALLERIQREL